MFLAGQLFKLLRRGSCYPLVSFHRPRAQNYRSIGFVQRARDPQGKRRKQTATTMMICQHSETRISFSWIIVRVNEQASGTIGHGGDERPERECGRSVACDECTCARQRTRSLADAFSTVWRTRSVDDSRLSYSSRCGIGQAVDRLVGRSVARSIGR